MIIVLQKTIEFLSLKHPEKLVEMEQLGQPERKSIENTNYIKFI